MNPGARPEPPRLNLAVLDYETFKADKWPDLEISHRYYNHTGVPLVIAQECGANFGIGPVPYRNEGVFVVETSIDYSAVVDFDPLDEFRNTPIGLCFDINVIMQEHSYRTKVANQDSRRMSMRFVQKVPLEKIERAGGSVWLPDSNIVVSLENAINSQLHPGHTRTHAASAAFSEHLEIWRNVYDELPDTHYVEIADILHPIPNKNEPDHPEGYWVRAGGVVKNYSTGDIMNHLAIFRSVREYEIARTAREAVKHAEDDAFKALCAKLTGSVKSVADLAEALSVSNKLLLRAEQLEKSANKAQLDSEIGAMKSEMEMLKQILTAAISIIKLVK